MKIMKGKQNKANVRKGPPQVRYKYEDRPIESIKRLEAGHLEMDSVIGKREKGKTIASTIDRKIGHVALSFANGKDSVSFLGATKENPKKYIVVKSAIIDNGGGNAKLGKLGIPIYNTNPYSSWEKGCVEVMHKYIRRFWPKRNIFWK